MRRLTFFLAAVLLVLIAQEAPCRELTFSIGPHDRNALRYSDMRVEEADPLSITTGRFLSVDPTWESAGLQKPQSWNRYAYVLNNPINNTDPDGRMCSAAGIDCLLTGASVAGPAGAVVGAVVGAGVVVYVGSKINWRAVGEWLASGNTGGGDQMAAETSVQNWAKSEQAKQDSEQTGTIYEVPGEATTSGRPYVGRHNKPEPNKTRKANDGRDRTKAQVIDTYDASNTQEGRTKEQKAIDDRGGVPNLDNKRNEIAPKKEDLKQEPPQ